MKKLSSIVLSIFCLISCFMLTACNKNNYIDMSVYFKPTVTAKVYNDGTSTKLLTLNDVISDTPSATDKYLQYSLIADNSWFYGMYVEKISFYIYSTETREVEFDITLTGTQNGKEVVSSATKNFEKTLPFYLKANKGVLVTIDVNDTITLSVSNSTLKIMPTDPYTVFTDNNFKYCIYGLKVSAYHK